MTEIEELKATIARMEAVIRDKDNMPQAIVEVLHRIAEGVNMTNLVITRDGEPYVLPPEASQQLAWSLYRALIEELGITAKIERLDQENQNLEAENQALRERLAKLEAGGGGAEQAPQCSANILSRAEAEGLADSAQRHWRSMIADCFERGYLIVTCAGCGRSYPCPSDCPCGTGFGWRDVSTHSPNDRRSATADETK